MGAVRGYIRLMSLFFLLKAGDNLTGVYTLSGETISDDSFGDTGIAGIRFNSDGTVDKNEAGVFTQIDSATDWIIPNGAASGNERVRYTSMVGDDFTTKAALEDTWIAISGNPAWSLETDTSPQSLTGTCTFEIDNGSGPVLASASYTFESDESG
jgi:hypothetical protein